MGSTTTLSEGQQQAEMQHLRKQVMEDERQKQVYQGMASFRSLADPLVSVFVVLDRDTIRATSADILLVKLLSLFCCA